MDREEIVRRLESALDAQRQDALDRINRSWYWGDTGRWVARAIVCAEPILAVPADGDLRAWLASRPQALEAAHEAYRAEEEDPDGYGSGTFWELRRELDAIVAGAAS